MADDLLARAHELGADHAELNHRGRLHHRMHSGREIARALGAPDLEGEQVLAIRDSYNFGWSSWA
jgi:hypothetical protein